MADGIDAELQLEANFSGPIRESDKLVQNILKMVQQMRGFEKVVLDAQKSMSQLGKVSGKEITEAFAKLRVLQEGSVQGIANRTAVRTVGNSLAGTDAARDRDIELKRLEDRRRFVQLGNLEFQQSQKQKALGEAININSQMRLKYEKSLIDLGKLSGRSDEYSLRLKSQIISELTNEIAKENEILRLKKEQERAEKAKIKQANTDPLERFNRNGGADIFRIQTRLLLNYKLIASAYSSTAFVGNFIVQLDKAFYNLQAITQSTEKDMGNLKIALLDAASATKFTAVEVTNAAVILGQAGLSSKQIQDSIKSVTLLASATGTGLEQAVATASTALNVFQLQASEMANVANLMTASVNESKLSIEQLSLGLQYAGSVAASAGIPLTELLASFGVLADQGIKSGSTLGTSIRQLVKDLQAPTKKMTDKLAELGLKFSDIDIKSQGFTGALNNLTKAGFTAADAFQVFETRAVPAFIALTRGGDSIELARQKLILSNAAVEANQTQMKSLSNTWSNFQSVSSALVNEGLAPFLRFMQAALESVNNFLVSNKKIVAGLGILIGVFAGFAATNFLLFMGGVLKNLLGVTGGIRAVAAAMGILTVSTNAATGAAIGFNIATGGVLLIVGSIIGGLVAAAGTMGLFSDSLGDSASKMDDLQTKVDESQGRLQNYGDVIDETTKFLVDYGAKQDRLTPGSLALKTAILEAQAAFGKLSDATFGASNSIGELLGKVEDLRNAQIGEAINEAATTISGLDAQIKGIKAATTERSVRATLNDVFTKRDRQPDGFLADYVGAFPGVVSQRPRKETFALQKEIVNSFSPTGAKLDEVFSAQNKLQDYRKNTQNLNQRDLQVIDDLLKKLEDLGNAVRRGESKIVERSEIELNKLADSRYLEKKAELDQAFKLTQEAIKVQRDLASVPGLSRKDREAYLAPAEKANNDLINQLGSILGDDPVGVRALGKYFPLIQKAIQDTADGISEFSADYKKYDEDKQKTSLATIELQKKSIDLAVAKTQRPATAFDVDNLKSLQSKEAALKFQALLDQQSTKSFGKSLDPKIIEQLNLEEQNTFRENLRIEHENEVAALKNKNQKHIEELRAVDIRDTDARLSLIEESTRRYQDKLQEIENISLGVDTKISANTGRVESFDQPQNRNAISQSDRYFAEQEAKQLDIEQKGTNLLQLSEKISAADKARLEAIGLEQAAMSRLAEARKDAFAATDNKSRSLAEEAARAAATEAKEARDKVQEHTKTQQELNRELVKTQAYYEQLTATTPSTVNFEKTLQFWRETSGAVDSLAVSIENGIIAALDAARDGLSSWLEDFVTGAATAKEAFAGFARGVIQSMLQIAAQRAATGIIDMIAGSVLGGLAGSVGGKQVYSKPIGPTQGFHGLATGGYVSGGRPNRDSVPAMLMPGEYVLNKNAVETIGKDTLHLLNAGVKKNQSVASGIAAPANDRGGSGGIVNVYVVNKEGMPPVGPNDVIAVVGDNIARGGSLKTLIKQVALS